MKHLSKFAPKVFITLLAVMLASSSLVGCFGNLGEPTLSLPQAQIQSPDIIESGVLKVGFDTSRAPLAGNSNGEIIGIDVEFAAAMAELLGLTLEKVDISGQDANALLANNTVDVIMGIQSESASEFTHSQVGPYLVDGPAIFTVGHTDDATAFDTSTLDGIQIAAQQNTLSAYEVSQEFGDEDLLTLPTLPEVFDKLSSGEVSYAAADALAGSFLSVSRDNIRCVGMLNDARGVYMGVASGKQNLTTKLTDAMKTLRDGGNLQVIVSGWLGPVSSQTVLSTEAITSQSSAAATTGGTTAEGTTADGGSGAATTTPEGADTGTGAIGGEPTPEETGQWTTQ